MYMHYKWHLNYTYSLLYKKKTKVNGEYSLSSQEKKMTTVKY